MQHTAFPFSQLTFWTILVTYSLHLLQLCGTAAMELGHQLNNTGGIKAEVSYTHITHAPCHNCSNGNTKNSHIPALLPDDKAMISDSDLSIPPSVEGAQTCVIQGHLKFAHNWYGYLATLKIIPEGGKVYYKFTYPQDMCCLKLLLYLTEDVDMLRAHMSCMQKQAIIHPQSDQVITLSPRPQHSGCKTVVDAYSGTKMLECKSGRLLKSKEVREWYLAVSNCGSPIGLDFEYSLIVFGHVGKCPVVNTTSMAAVLKHSYILGISLWVLWYWYSI